MNRVISFLLCVFVFCSILAGCSGGKDVSSQPVSDDGDGSGVLNTAGPFGGSGTLSNKYASLLEDFRSKNPTVNVNDESGINDEAWKESISGKFEKSDSPDVVFFYKGSPAERMISRGDFVSIDVIRSVYPEYATNISNAALASMREGDGYIYAVPVMASYEGLFVHSDLFSEHGVKLPTDWEKFVQAVITFSKTNIIPISAGFSDYPQRYVDNFLLSAGGAGNFSIGSAEIKASEDTPLSGLSSGSKGGAAVDILSSWATGLDVIKGLHEIGAFIINVSSTPNKVSIEAFNSKQTAMRIDDSWFIYDVTDKENTVFMPVPAIDGGLKTDEELVGGFTMGFYISKKAWNNADKRDAAVKFVMHMTSNESINIFSELSGAPATPLDQPDKNNLSRTAKEVYNSAETLVPGIVTRINDQAWNYLMQNIGPIVDNRITVDEVLKGFKIRN